MRNLALITAGTCLVFALAVRAQNQDDPRAVVDRAIKAHGGEKTLQKIQISQSKAKGTMDVANQSIPFTADGSVQLPDRIKVVIEMELNNMKIPIVQVVNGNKGWVSVQGQTKELDKETMEQSRQDLHASEVGNLTCLKDSRYKLAALGESKVDGKEAVGVQVSTKGFRDVNLYFDKGTGLLVKSEIRALDPVSKQEITQEKIYSGYRETEGVKTPTKIVVKNDGKRFMEMEVTEVHYPGELDPKTFERP